MMKEQTENESNSDLKALNDQILNMETDLKRLAKNHGIK
jgi:hypothetical protein